MSSESQDEKFGTKPEIIKPTKWGEKPNAPTVRTVENIDEYKIISKAFDKENRGLIMPVISADQFAAFDAIVPAMIDFYTKRTEKVNPKYQPDETKPDYDPLFAIPLEEGEIPKIPDGVRDMFEFFDDFRNGNLPKDIIGYRTALTAENGYFGELISRWLESIKSAEQKGTGGSEPRRGWSRLFLGGH